MVLDELFYIGITGLYDDPLTMYLHDSLMDRIAYVYNCL